MPIDPKQDTQENRISMTAEKLAGDDDNQSIYKTILSDFSS
jgi:hypothetical protein